MTGKWLTEATGRRAWVAAIVTGAFALGAAGAGAAVQVKKDLTATVHAPGAKGKAKLVLRSAASGKFTIAARRLAPNHAFDVIVHHIKVATLHTTRGGSGRAQLSAPANRHDGMLGVDPRGDQVEVRDDQGDDVLVGDMPDDAQDPNAIACCVAHGHETECEDLTLAACAAANGTPTAGTSCLPDPCNAAPPANDGMVCCLSGSAAGAVIDDDPEIECEDVSAADCAAAGGVAVQAASCDPNPCAPVPPPQVVICCVPDGGEAECEEVTPEHCTAQAGTVSTAPSCESDPCGGEDGNGDHQGNGDGNDNGGDAH